jgi:hypothetical protein
MFSDCVQVLFLDTREASYLVASMKEAPFPSGAEQSGICALDGHYGLQK